EQAVRAGAVVDDLAGSSRIDGERSVGRVERGKPHRGCSKATLEGISPGRIEDHDLDLRPFAVDVGQDLIDADSVATSVGLGPKLRVHRNEVGLSRDLDAVAAEVE